MVRTDRGRQTACVSGQRRTGYLLARGGLDLRLGCRRLGRDGRGCHCLATRRVARPDVRTRGRRRRRSADTCTRGSPRMGRIDRRGRRRSRLAEVRLVN